MESHRTITETYSRRPRHKYGIFGLNRPEVLPLEVSSPSSSRSFFSVIGLKQLLIAVFLPQGFPHSVTDDYLEYQIWDTLQALASSLTGALATEAVLTGAGVGNKEATALAAAMTWLLKDGCGMVGRIVFSYAKGTELDAECKKWRLIADVLNDIAFFIDLLSPAFPSLFLLLACTSSLFRCIVGVAGGATRTAIVQHQARRHNLADVAAKDGSQETLVNVIALIISLVLLPTVSGKRVIIWSLFMMFTTVHLFANYRAVRSLRLEIFNRNRAIIAIRHFFSASSVPPVSVCNREEPLFQSLMGRVHLGCSRHDIDTRDFESKSLIWRENYMVEVGGEPAVAMRTGSTPEDQLHAVFDVVAAQLKRDGEKEWERFKNACEKMGYRTDVNYFCFDEWEWNDK